MSHPELFWEAVKPREERNAGKVEGKAKQTSCARLLKKETQQESQEVIHIDAKQV
jgi:hypothetical protein